MAITAGVKGGGMLGLTVGQSCLTEPEPPPPGRPMCLPLRDHLIVEPHLCVRPRSKSAMFCRFRRLSEDAIALEPPVVRYHSMNYNRATFQYTVLVLQRRMPNMVSSWKGIASRKPKSQSCQARGQAAMERCSRPLSCEASLYTSHVKFPNSAWEAK